MNTTFMNSVFDKLKTEKDLTDSTALKYIRNLVTLNNRQLFKNLAFLRKHDNINDLLKVYAPTTRKTLLGTIVSVLRMYKSKPGYKQCFAYWEGQMQEAISEFKKTPKNKLTDKKMKNWIDWTNVVEIQKLLNKKIDGIRFKTITAKEYNDVLSSFILSLYTAFPPRRNIDYMDMYVVKRYKKNMPEDKNYLDLDKEQFIFNKYKTKKKHGQQIISFEDNDDFKHILKVLLKVHPLVKGRWKEVPMLVNSQGNKFTANNSITRLLNRIFGGKKVGSTMLRHSYLSHRYGDELAERKKDAEAMGHDVTTAQNYIITDT